MVVFTCSACGESVKKAQVEKHVNVCSRCECLSCMDCGRDFWGDDYKDHVKCISEDQKYGGKDFEAKTNKGDAKQQEWIQKIHEVMKKPNINPKVRNVLEQMRVFGNIPRKKVKFQNWMKNSLRITDSSLQDQVWGIFSEAAKDVSEKEHDKPQQKEEVQSAGSGEKTMVEKNGVTDDKSERKKNKRERKEERQKKKKKEKKEQKLESQPVSSETKKNKKPKKGKESLENEFEINGNSHQNEIEEETNVRKRKHKHVEETKSLQNFSSCFITFESLFFYPISPLEEPRITAKRMKTENISEDVEMENTNGNEETVGTDKGKFNWKGTIKAVLRQAPDNEISIKKLRKKVIAQYYAVAGEHHKSEEDILVIFNKKVNNNPKFKVLKDKVKLLK
ncbi:LYAR protein, partial [Penelope pileata]|nr:LYAR protein [Penelope pileata]